MPILYIITGPAGVGKSTISKELAMSSNKSVLIEGDDIYHQVVGGYTPAWKDGNHLQTFWKVCVDIIKIYLDDGYDVIFNYIVTPNNIEIVKEKLKNYIIKSVVLLTNDATLLSRDKERSEDWQMKKRCITLLKSYKRRNYNAQNILDTTNLSISHTLEIIKNDNRFILLW